MKNVLIGIISILTLNSCLSENKEWMLSSPNGNLKITVRNFNKEGNKKNELIYSVRYKKKEVILNSPLGIDREDKQFSENLEFVTISKPILIDEKYTLKSGKKMECHNYANEQSLTFKNVNGEEIQLIFRAYNDGIAFRYNFPKESSDSYKITDEKTGFKLSTDGKAWIHPYHWNSRKKPSYEDYCENEIPIGANSPKEQGWAYPMLFNTVDDLWVMVTEAVMDGTYCATHVRSSGDGLYRIHFAEKDEVVIPDDPEPVSTLPWATPWRVIVVSDKLSDIVETNIVQNLNLPSKIVDETWITPGRSSWSWWSNGASSKDYKTQIMYVDFTADMGWEYMLIDAGWPNMEGGTMEDVVKYANSKNVGVWLWYHSGAGRTEEPLGMMNIMSKPEERRKELARIHALGVKGIKVDFFDTDKQGVVKMYKELLEDAAENHIMVNFHGATLPRGLERTYPNLMTTEAIKGAEAFGQQPACDKAPGHNATVPFTRNVVGSMDYTPVTFSNKVRQGVEAINITTYSHQLALSVVFESGVQNFADKMEVYQALPDAPKNFLKKVPVSWDETRFVSGYPEDYIVIARRKGDIWYIGGINGKKENRTIQIKLPFITTGKNINLITDGENREEFSEREEKADSDLSVKVLPYGGFVATIEL